MLPNLTEIEEKILDYMVSYLRENTYQPSIREIGERFGIKSTKTVSEHLQALADKGFLERDPSRSRGVKILGMDLDAPGVSVPCFSRLPEDGKGPRADRAESFLTLDRRLAGEKGAFFVQASAEELAPLGCIEGDYILMEPASLLDLTDGAIVAAKFEGPATYYRLSRNESVVQLYPLTGKGSPILVGDSTALVLLGRITGMYRRMDHLPAAVTAIAH
ncbi:MAG: transcriptional repressor LexA [Gemmatimonadota bacterium]|jgi:repressor LexA